MNAAQRFRQAVDARDVAAMVATLSPDIELHSPTMLPPVRGRDRVHGIFVILLGLFEDFEYTRILDGELVGDDPSGTSTHALMFSCRIGEERLEGIDVLDIDSTDHIARFTVMIRPMSGLQALGAGIAERLAAARSQRDDAGDQPVTDARAEPRG